MSTSFRSEALPAQARSYLCLSGQRWEMPRFVEIALTMLAEKLL